MRGEPKKLSTLPALCTSLPSFDASVSIMTLRWQEKLKLLYYDGFVSEKELNDLLEIHRRDTASTFGTRKSSNKPASATAPKSSGSTAKTSSTDENVNKLISTCTTHCNIIRMPSENHQVGSAAVDIEGVRFLWVKKRILDCQHGVQYYKPKRGSYSSIGHEENWLHGPHYPKGIHPLPRLQCG